MEMDGTLPPCARCGQEIEEDSPLLCGEGRIHRPISDFDDERAGQFIHAPCLNALRPCNCGARAWVRAGHRARPS
jgi:hypothetical protein